MIGHCAALAIACGILHGCRNCPVHAQSVEQFYKTGR